MSALITQLKSEHAKLASLLTEVTQLGVGSKEGQTKLNSAKAGLLAHLKLEDEQLYPLLRKEAEKDPKLKATLEMLAKDMEKVSKETLDFFAKYAQGGEQMEFARDFGRLLHVLSTRIQREESTIYIEFEKRGLQKAA